ncbi:MAG: NAD(P)H-dependent oxidoreductase [Pseudomonadota bacterium]
MHVLIVIDHPTPKSFTHAAANRFADGTRDAGHTTEIADLYAEGFDPRWSVADREQDSSGTSVPDVRAEQERIERSDAICLAFPLFWYGMPAMMKGWMDRVFAFGWAYDQLDDPTLSALKDRPGVFLIPAAARRSELERCGAASGMERIWRDGTFGYFGLRKLQTHFLCGSEGSDARRAGLLEAAYQAGRRL